MGVTTFVASNLPPNPTSNTATSTAVSAKCWKAMAVVYSKKVATAPVGREPEVGRSTAPPAIQESSRIHPYPFSKIDKMRGGIEPTRSSCRLQHRRRHGRMEPFPFVRRCAGSDTCSAACRGAPSAPSSSSRPNLNAMLFADDTDRRQRRNRVMV